jgi:2-polyprenyl-6-methoxyphenol hydroxylase-like FAD-dependent oxidoreductase
MSKPMQQVVIVGAGPAGLTLGAELSRRGVCPLILDRLEAGSNTSRAAVVHARTLEVLRPLGITDELLANGVIVSMFRVRDRGKVLTSISFKDLPTEFPFTLMCPQNVTESVLLRRLEGLGSAVTRPRSVTAVRPLADCVEVDFETAEEAGGMQQTVATEWLVGCDGGHSLVRDVAGIAFEGGTYQETFILADVEMDWPIARDEVSLFFSEQGLVVVAPLPNKHFRIVATVREAPEKPSVADFQQLLIERGPPDTAIRITRMVWSSRFRVSHRVASSFRQGRILLAGDAAHVHSPAGGQGMNTGIQDAVALAEALVAVLAGGDSTLLNDWAIKRREIASSVVRLTDRMTRAATVSSPMMRALRNMAVGIVAHLPMAQAALAEKLSELDNR